MKLTFLSLVALGVMSAAGLAQAPVGPGSVKVNKVQPAVVKTPEFQITGGQNKRYKLGEWLEVEVEFETKPEDIDELTFKYSILIEKKLLDGEISHINIPKGKDHFSVAYVSPRALERLTNGKPLTPASIDNVWIEVSRQGQVLDRQSFRPGVAPNVPHISGLVLNKSETPFAALYFDRYEAIKHQR